MQTFLMLTGAIWNLAKVIFVAAILLLLWSCQEKYGTARAQTTDFVQRSIDRTIVVQPDGRAISYPSYPGSGRTVISPNYNGYGRHYSQRYRSSVYRSPPSRVYEGQVNCPRPCHTGDFEMPKVRR